jgi:hypothetical protein
MRLLFSCTVFTAAAASTPKHGKGSPKSSHAKHGKESPKSKVLESNNYGDFVDWWHNNPMNGAFDFFGWQDAVPQNITGWTDEQTMLNTRFEEK